MTTTLLEYLTTPNPILDCSKSSTGSNSFNARWDTVTGLEEWPDFDYQALMQSYGHILQQAVPPLPDTSPPLTQLERKIFTERTFESVLEKDIMPKVSAALRVAWPLYYSQYESNDVVEIAIGAKARRGTTEEDDRFYADWAGIRECETTDFGYKNLCPGDTKLASKWRSSKEGRSRPDYTSPFQQIQTYCGRQWGVRHGFIISTEEFVAVRVSREPIGSGLATSRTARNVPQHTRDQPSHSRTFSAETISSGFQAMSLDTGSSFSDDANPNIEYRPLQFRSIPWKAAGKNGMTVKLGLWWLHMETRKDLSVQPDYLPPGSTSDPGQSASKSTKQPKDKGKGSGKKAY